MSKLRVTGLCAGNSPVTGEFPAQIASNAVMFPFDDVIMVIEFKTWMANHNPYFVDAITYRCPKRNADLVYIC